MSPVAFPELCVCCLGPDLQEGRKCRILLVFCELLSGLSDLFSKAFDASALPSLAQLNMKDSSPIHVSSKGNKLCVFFSSCVLAALLYFVIPDQFYVAYLTKERHF